MEREYVKWFSKQLQRQMEMLVFGSGGTPVIFFPTRTARFFDYENWRIIDAIKEKIEAKNLQVYCVDSIDIESFYSILPPAEKIKRHICYETYILKEVLPFIKKRNNSKDMIAAGCSLGAYHAVNVAFRHPHCFTKVLGMSGRYNLTLSSPKFPDLLEGFVDDNVYYNMPSMFIPKLNDEKIIKQLQKLQMTFVIGKEDPFLENNIELVEALQRVKIEPEIYFWDEEAHRPRYWRQMVKLYL